MNKDLNDASQRLTSLLSPLSALKGGYVYLSLEANQGEGIHAEEEFNPCIRVNGLSSQENDIIFLS